MAKSRSPLQVSDNFHKKMLELQKRIMMKTGEKPSLRFLTDKLINTNAFEELEGMLLKRQKNPNMIDFNIKFDRRLFQ